MLDRRELLCAAILAALGPALARAQTRQARIGVLTAIDRAKSGAFPPFVKQLADLGYLEGRNLTIDYRSSSGVAERLPALARELVALKPDLIVALGQEHPARALFNMKATLPVILIAVDYDPVEKGIVASYNRPGGNFTGVYIPQPALAAKRFELAREILPTAKRLLVFSDTYSQDQLAAVKKAAVAARVEIEVVEFAAPPYDFEAAFERGRKVGTKALVFLTSPEFQTNRERIAELLSKHRLPAIRWSGLHAEMGFLASYGAATDPVSARAAVIAARVLQGARPADLPVEQARDYEVGVNMKTAKVLGVKIPPSVLARATRVIE